MQGRWKGHGILVLSLQSSKEEKSWLAVLEFLKYKQPIRKDLVVGVEARDQKIYVIDNRDWRVVRKALSCVLKIIERKKVGL